MKQRPQVSPPPRRGGGRSLFPIVALISLALLALTVMPAIAQIPPPPPPPHTHNWVTTAIPTGTPNAVVSLEKSYLRCGEVVAITVNPPYGGYDKDSCTVGGCPLGGYDYNAVLWTDWSDNGAGGEFGRLNGGVFEICSAANVTHYKAGDTPGTGEIKVKINDVPEDGATGSSADDAEVWSTGGYPFTVYEFDITDTATAWEPKGGSEDNSTTYTARIRPTTDHNGASMAKVITFTLSSSSEPGYCVNFGSESTSDNDLAFTTQTGFNVTSGIYASTTSALTSATITVSCYDYGAYGTINASIPNPNSGGSPVSARLRRDTTIYEKVYGANIPYDYNDCNLQAGDKGGNRIPDLWSGDTGPGATCDPLDDNETQQPGAGVDGDGFTRYDEWRGLMLDAETHVRMMANFKELLLWVQGYSGVIGFPGNLGVVVRYGEVYGYGQAVNFNSDDTGHHVQHALKLAGGLLARHHYADTSVGTMDGENVICTVDMFEIAFDCNDVTWNLAGFDPDSVEHWATAVSLLCPLLNEDNMWLHTWPTSCVAVTSLPWSNTGGVSVPLFYCDEHVASWELK